MDKIVEIPVEKIKVGEHALRMEADDETLGELADSIRRIGILVPLVVVRAGDFYTLVAGHRRLAAAKRVGLREVPAVVRKLTDAAAGETAFAENLFRADLSPLEVAGGIKDVLDKGVMDIDGIARALGRTNYWVGRMLAMLDWPADVLEVIHNGKISVSAASNLAMVEDTAYRKFLVNNAVESGATARTTAAWLQAWRSLAPPEQALTAEPEPAGSRASPAVPQAPCLACGEVFRTDELSHVPICARCIQAIRNAGLKV